MPNPFRLLLLTALAVAALAAPVRADGIDCRAAGTPLERTICATPALLAQDRALATAFSEALAREPARAAEVRHDQIGWLKARNAACGKLPDDPARAGCLSAQYAGRLAELAPRKPAPVASAPAASIPVADHTPPPELPPPPPSMLPPAAAALEKTRLPTAPRMETLLHVTASGRFELSARSATGTALQLVDMLTGPSDLAGEPGAVDGRISALLEAGTYKLRGFADPAATGEVTLAVTPFRDAAPPRTLDLRAPLDTELGNLQQLSFWLEAKPGVPVWVEAAGRALADMKLWRNATDLVSLAPTVREIEPTRGHPLTDMQLRGVLEPGTYLLTLYGGDKLVWADGATAQPLHLRAGPSRALDAGVTSGTIGPFGSELFSIPAPAGSIQLDLPQPADVQLSLLAGGTVQAGVSIAHISREPTVRLFVPDSNDTTRLAEVSGMEGKPFRVRLETTSTSRVLAHPGRYWVSADAQGFGGDEPPATVVFLRQMQGRPPMVAGAVAPRVGPGLAWRRRFNLRGDVALLFEVAADGPVALTATGPAVTATVAPIGVVAPPRADGKKPSQWELAAGWYQLTLKPPANAVGVLDMTLGPPGLLPDHPAPAQPPDPSLALGQASLAKDESLSILAGSAPGAQIGLAARAVSVNLADAPLTVTQDAGVTLKIPVRLPADGKLLAIDTGGNALASDFALVASQSGRYGDATLPAPDQPRNVVLSWQPPPTPEPPVSPPTPPGALDALTPGTPRFLDLGSAQQHSFALAVAQGGLFRIETTGRLLTDGHIGTPFIPDLDAAAGNGIGQNFLIQRFLRAGSYRVRVAAQDSAGRLGVLARPAPVAEGATLVPGGSVRAALAADQGIVFPIAIAAAGRFHLDLLSLAHGLSARLEDAEGWPLLPAGDLSSLDIALRPGAYRLLVQPAGIAARVVARLAAVTAPVPHVGHGPFALPFGASEAATWREPPGRDDPRTPDQWIFSLAGPAAVTVAVGEGMVADLVADGSAAPLARFTSDTPYAGTLPAGGFRVRTTSLGRNDRLDYTLALTSQELQPGRPRLVTPPATEKFAIAADRVVSLTTFGRIPLRATLKRADGGVVERIGDRGTDWNVGLSRLLPAGAYTLELASAAPPRGDPVQPADAPQSDDQSNDQPAAAAPDQPADDPDAAPAKDTVEINLALPEDRPAVAAATEGATELRGGGVHHLMLPALPTGALGVVAAASSADLVLALERRDSGDPWQTVAIARGTTPVVGSVAGAEKIVDLQWRASVWTLDGGAEPIRVAARALDPPSVAPESVVPVPLDLSGLPQTLAVARVALPNPAPLLVVGDPAGLEGVSTPFAALAPVDDAIILPQTTQLWLLARGRAGPLALAPLRITPGQPLALTLPPHRAAYLSAAAPAVGHVRFWLAESGLGQPRLDAGGGMGVAAGSTLAPDCGCQPATLSDASLGEGRALPVRVTALDLAEREARALDAPFGETVPPFSALPLHLPGGVRRLHFDLAPGTAAVINAGNRHGVTVWTGHATVSRTVEGDVSDLLLVNTTGAAAPAAVAWSAGDAQPLALRPGTPLKRFFGAAGSVDLPILGVDVTRHERRLIVVGGTATLLDDLGLVQRGTNLPVLGAGRLTIDHGPGLLAAWIEGGDVPPWPEPAPVATALPAHIALHDAAMTLALSPTTPILLHASSTAPIILAVGDEPPAMFAAGAELFRYLPLGPERLRIISPHDGPLAGTLDLSAAPIAEAAEGIGATVAVAPGGTAAFGFAVAHKGEIGVGIRATPDVVSARLLDAAGRVLGEGVAQLHTLAPGRYVLEARVPADAPATLVRPALVGLVPRPNGPPQNVVNDYLALAGRAPIQAAAKGTAP